MNETKKCSKCEEEKPATTEYFRRSASYGGLQSVCKDCRKEVEKNYRKIKKERVEKINSGREIRTCAHCQELKYIEDFNYSEKGQRDIVCIDCENKRHPLSGVYFIRCEDFVKIGYSSNIIKRKKTIQRHNPLQIHLIGYIECEDLCEKEQEVQKFFRLQRVRGEWFSWNEVMEKYIKDYATQYKGIV